MHYYYKNILDYASVNEKKYGITKATCSNYMYTTVYIVHVKVGNYINVPLSKLHFCSNTKIQYNN